MNIALTVSEANLRSLLLNVTKDLQVVRPDAKPVTMRLAGGWVRDKVKLGCQSPIT